MKHLKQCQKVKIGLNIGKKIDLPELTIYPPTKEYVGDIDYLPLYAGQSVENIVSIKSASEVLSRLASEMSEKN